MSEEEFEKQTLNKLIIDLKDIDKYTSFKNGAFIYDLGKYQGTLLVNHIEHLQQENKRLKSILTELEEWLENNWKSTQDIWYVKIIEKIKELREEHK